ncbi:MAG: lactate utilization protein [Spirochaetales bacterium]|jgi:hypothetical protein|nr:lactate utilization protein [Spirochaetales bacterium]
MDPRQNYNRVTAERVLKNLTRRGFEAFYEENAAAALEKAKALIEPGASVSWGGTMTMAEIGLEKYLKDNAGLFTLLDRDAAPNPQEKRRIYSEVFWCRWYIMSTNALTLEGILVNIDGLGNRLASLLFGPENVLVIAGINKLAADEDSALKRIRQTASPLNVQRLNKNTPCAKTGFCADCLTDDCICSHTVFTRRSNPKGRIKVLLVGENLGY